MNACERVRPRAAMLASLPSNDLERKAAFEHAARCEGCALALDEGQKLLPLIDGALDLPPPSDTALRRVAASIKADFRAISRKASNSMPLRFGLIAASAISAAALLAKMHADFDDARTWILALSLAGGGAVALALRALSPARALGVLLLLSAIGVALSTTGTGIESEMGLHCAMFQLMGAALPLGVLVGWRLYNGCPIDPVFGADAAAIGSLAMQGAMVLLCSAGGLQHLLVFHFGAVLLAALLGAAAAKLPVPRSTQA